MKEEQWEPVPDGMYKGKTAHELDYEVDGEWIRVSYQSAKGWGCKIPTELGWRLCRQVEDGERESEGKGGKTMIDGPWNPLVPEEKGEEGYIIVMCPAGGELHCYLDGTVIAYEGTRMWGFRLPPSVRLFHTKSMGRALAERGG
jgi:hypothetical protein